jgi:dTDP-4-amino-4,6-dideoxygalactose transaminase
MLPLVDLRRQYASVKDEIDATVLESIARADYILGEDVQAFEREFAAYCDADFCAGVGSGTAAILLALEALGLSEGDEVIAPANTFIATILPVMKLGGRPVLVDCDEMTRTLDVEQVSRAIGPRTAAVVAVHLYGHPADMEPLLAVCAEHGIPLVEDACQAHGARYRGRRVGSLGTIAAFSFYPGKNLGAYGDGGAVTTNDPKLLERVLLLRDLGQARKYEHVLAGWNERLDTIQAAVLRVKLRHLDRWNELRRRHAEAYAAALADSGLVLPAVQDGAEHVWHLYVVQSRDRDGLRGALAAQGVATGMHYPVPVHLQPAVRGLGYARGAFPVAESLADGLLSLPMFPELERDEIDLVATAATRHLQAA